MSKVWLVTEMDESGTDHIIGICATGTLAKEFLLRYCDFRMSEVIKYTRNSMAQEPFKEAKKYFDVDNDIYENMYIGQSKFGNRFGIECYDLISTLPFMKMED